MRFSTCLIVTAFVALGCRSPSEIKKPDETGKQTSTKKPVVSPTLPSASDVTSNPADATPDVAGQAGRAIKLAKQGEKFIGACVYSIDGVVSTCNEYYTNAQDYNQQCTGESKVIAANDPNNQTGRNITLAMNRAAECPKDLTVGCAGIESTGKLSEVNWRRPDQSGTGSSCSDGRVLVPFP